MPAWAPLLIGLAGALIGAGGAIGSQLIAASRTTRREQRKRRSDAAIKLVAATYAVMDQADHLVHTSADRDGAREARERYLEAWRDFHPAYAEALLTAPHDLVRKVRRIRHALYRLTWPTDAWYTEHTRRGARAELQEDAWTTAHSEAETARRDYLLAARQSLPDLAAISASDVPTSDEEPDQSH